MFSADEQKNVNNIDAEKPIPAVSFRADDQRPTLSDLFPKKRLAADGLNYPTKVRPL
jgi:hypothetical protein